LIILIILGEESDIYRLTKLSPYFLITLQLVCWVPSSRLS
jgi:hypothetical protein